MPTQLNLPSFDPEAARPIKLLTRPQGIHGFKHKLFFAIFPAPEDAIRILQRAESLRQQHRFTEELIEAERLHITLQVLGESPRFLRRLQLLRRWSYEQVEQVLTRGA